MSESAGFGQDSARTDLRKNRDTGRLAHAQTLGKTGTRGDPRTLPPGSLQMPLGGSAELPRASGELAGGTGAIPRAFGAHVHGQDAECAGRKLKRGGASQSTSSDIPVSWGASRW